MHKLSSSALIVNPSRRLEPFRFKQFCVAHSRSAMRVGVDGVLIGAWADVDGLPEGGVVLDAGCGCGVITLMMAQRCLSARIVGVDCHKLSVQEASENVLISPWKDRVEIIYGDVMSIAGGRFSGRVSLIVSNPPFFASGISLPDTPRLAARHAIDFGPLSLPAIGERLLMPAGRLALIAPAEMEQAVREQGETHGLSVRRICRVVTVAGKHPARVMIEFVKAPAAGMENTLVIHDENHAYTSEYKELTKEFYIKF